MFRSSHEILESLPIFDINPFRYRSKSGTTFGTRLVPNTDFSRLLPTFHDRLSSKSKKTLPFQEIFRLQLTPFIRTPLAQKYQIIKSGLAVRKGGPGEI